MPTLFTVGHSTRSFDEFVQLLQAHNVQGVADVRRFPGSKRLPQFNAEHLSTELPRRGLLYEPCPLLGGRRKPNPDSINLAWRNASFRAYADYMQTPEFADGLALLMASAERRPMAMMCAEAVPWRCHRSLVADALWARGVEVQHLSSATRSEPHRLTAFARVHGTQVLYPGSPDEARLVPESGAHA